MIRYSGLIRLAAMLSLFLLMFCACVKQETGDFKLEYRMKLELPADANPLLTHVFEQRMASGWVQFLIANHLETKDIKWVKPRSVVLSPVFDNPVGYELIREAHVSVYDLQDPGGKLPIADLYDPVGNPDELVLLPGLANLKDILSQPEFVLNLELNVRVVPGSVSEHFLTVQFDVFLN